MKIALDKAGCRTVKKGDHSPYQTYQRKRHFFIDFGGAEFGWQKEIAGPRQKIIGKGRSAKRKSMVVDLRDILFLPEKSPQMGIVRKQTIQSSLSYYLGAAVGFLNRTVVFTQFLPTDQVGLTSFLLANALLYSQFSALGLPNIILRYFPFFRDKERGHHRFFFWSLVISLVGFLFVTLHFVLFKPLISGYMAENSPQFVEYYYYLIPLGFFTLYMEIFDNYLRSLFKTVVPVFIREVGQRLMITVAVLVYAAGWVDFEGFVILFVVLASSVSLIMVAYLIYLGQFHITPGKSWRMRKLRGRLLKFGSFSYLSGISTLLIYTIDQWMLAGMKGMAEVGIYATSFYITSMLLIPWKALSKISSPLVPEHWKNKDMGAMQKLYRRTSMLSTMAGVFLFGGLMLSSDFIFSLMPDEYAQGLMVLFYIGLTRVFIMLTGLNGMILLTSKHYRWDLLLTIVAIGIAVASNYYLIEWRSVEGAAMATLLTFGFINLSRLVLVWFFFGLHPFSWRMGLTLVFAVLAYLVQWAIPVLDPLFLDFLVRGSVFTCIFGSLVLGFRIAPDVNDLAILMLRKAGLRRD